MRHLYGVALAIALAAGVFFGAAWGYFRLLHASALMTTGLPANGGSLWHQSHVLQGGGALLAVGLATGLLMVIPWVSPLAAGLPGLVLVGWTALYLSDVKEAAKLIPLKSHDFGTGFESLLFSGLLGAFGLIMIAPLFIPSRWTRRSPVAAYSALGESTLIQPAVPGSDADQTIAGFTTPSSGGESNVLTDWAQTRPQQGPITPPGGSQAPWGPPDQG